MLKPAKLLVSVWKKKKTRHGLANAVIWAQTEQYPRFSGGLTKLSFIASRKKSQNRPKYHPHEIENCSNLRKLFFSVRKAKRIRNGLSNASIWAPTEQCSSSSGRLTKLSFITSQKKSENRAKYHPHELQKCSNLQKFSFLCQQRREHVTDC